jgi:hypothetical protein
MKIMSVSNLPVDSVLACNLYDTFEELTEELTRIGYTKVPDIQTLERMRVEASAAILIIDQLIALAK